MDDYICIYLYNLSFQVEGDPPITTIHYLFEPHTYTTNSVENRIVALADDIHPNPNLHGTCCGTKFSDLQRRRKGYVAFVVDPPGDSALKNIKMKYKRFIIGHEEASHTFHHIITKKIYVEHVSGQPRALWLGYFYNHMRNDDGNELNDESESHRYYLKFGPEVGIATTSNLISYEDSGGTNTGPPVSPPALLI